MRFDRLARIYAILDRDTLDRLGLDLVETALRLRDEGLRLFQYRDKRVDLEAILGDARRLADALRPRGCQLILNDHADLVDASGFDGLHVGQGDLDASGGLGMIEDRGLVGIRTLLGAGPILGVSTHNETQLRSAAIDVADYVAIGPVFPTSTKADAEPVVGLGGVRRARELTGKPLVAIGGISAANAREVMEAGADSVAVVAALFGRGIDVGKAARRLMDAVGG